MLRPASGLTPFKSLLSILALAAGLAPATLLAQETYPQRPITLVVPHPPGGSVDGVARIYAEQLGKELGQSVVVENRAGASGMIGAAYVARATPDGYTLYLNASIHAINPLLYKKTIKFDAVKDFTPISELAQGALIFSANPGVPAHNVQELVQVLKAAPQKYSFATTGFGSAGHLAAASFLHENGLSQIPIVLYRGGGPALSDLVGGQVHAMFDPMLSSLPMVRANKLNALAVTGAERSPLLADVPTLREQGQKNFEFYSWYGVWGPAGLPAPVLKKLEAVSARIMASPKVVEQLGGLGFEPSVKDSAAFASFIDAEMKRYQAIIEQAKIEIAQ
ncbi:Bug family tripartite tricarboxylate transporter substrate binding protein [Achromobacter deleyi]|uniref:Bug family tripartite tricarboxylate transporter substrate binding protein n=1 Tax=Achromobacter deleyi TaxID=1353891 RepID=UPI0014924844|nr:tripartite tricarboxylate transporter substrate binding protein [Achromobacter deleyi]QVQ24191.1 tripartite tricarboxylate transporter substrate binding protein [Achromobacter deleyi]UIP19722.1 tripartite tricarboxylate transporter substrate binding protein [Achromobacter deleyi]